LEAAKEDEIQIPRVRSNATVLPVNTLNNPFDVQPKIWDWWHEYVYPPEKPKLEPWETIKQGLDKHDDEMSKAWNDELNTLLTFVRDSTLLKLQHIDIHYRLVYSRPR